METRLVTNNPIENTKVGYELNSLLKKCNEFCISVAFINKSGLAVLKQALLDLEAKNIHGKVITSTYLGFNEPQTFKELLTFKNVDVRIYEGDGFHPKGYIFNLD